MFEFEKCKSFTQRARTSATVRDGFAFPEAGSPMQLDDQALKPLYDATKIEGLSSTSKLTALMAETQLLEAWPAGQTDENGIRVVAFPPYSGFTLLRGSMEASSLALWLLENDDRTERLSRFAGLITYSQDQYLNVISEFHSARGNDDSGEAQAFNAKVAALLDSAGIEPRNYPRSTKLIEKAGRYISCDELNWSPKVAWQVASGVAHGLPWSIQEAVRVVQGKAPGRVVHKVDAASYRYVYEAATVMFETLVERIQELQAAPPEATDKES